MGAFFLSTLAPHLTCCVFGPALQAGFFILRSFRHD
nr:MAG TPA: hypothetical protein [Caudoviricetes sp.]